MFTRTLLCVLACCLLLPGCGDGGAAVLERRSNLEQLGQAYLEFYAAKGVAPADASELKSQLNSQSAEDPVIADAVESLEEGDIVVNYKGVLENTAADADRVLAFEARAPASGGYVVMGDGTVKLMTGKEFSEAIMLSPSPSSAM